MVNVAWNFVSIKASMNSWLGIPADDTRRLPQGVKGEIINARHREMARRGKFRSLEAVSTPIAFVAGDYEHALPSDWQSPMSVWLTDDTGEKNMLEGITISEYDAIFTDNGNRSGWATPVCWTVSGSSMLIGPPPQVGGILAQRYYKIPADLTVEAPTSDITAIAGEALLHFANADASGYILEEGRAPWFLARAEELFQEALSQSSRRIYDGRRPVSKEP
jgi:hypothetical protein